MKGQYALWFIANSALALLLKILQEKTIIFCIPYTKVLDTFFLLVFNITVQVKNRNYQNTMIF